MLRSIFICTLLTVGLIAGVAQATPRFFFGASQSQLLYLQFSDSPFAYLTRPSALQLENFEDGLLNTPGVSVNPGAVILGPDAFRDSVDEDDGFVDGSGLGGYSLYSGNTLSTFRFEFSAAALGSLPTHAAIVWTDVGNVSSGTFGFGGVLFRAFGPANVPLGSIGPYTVGDGMAMGSTEEDRILGVIDFGGISAIEISMNNSVDWEVDHLQYSIETVPEPGSLALMLSGGVMLLWMVRRRR